MTLFTGKFYLFIDDVGETLCTSHASNINILNFVQYTNYFQSR